MHKPTLFRAWAYGCDRAGRVMVRRSAADRPSAMRILGEPMLVQLGSSRGMLATWVATIPEVARYGVLAGVLGTTALIALRAVRRSSTAA